MLHFYLEGYYKELWAGEQTSQTAHQNALILVAQRFTEKIAGLVFAAQAAGEQKLGLELSALRARAFDLCNRYYVARGVQDAIEHAPLYIEQKIVLQLDTGIELACVVDLVTQDQQGLTWLWEHKSASDVPSQSHRLKDLQTLLAVAVVEQASLPDARLRQIDGIIWNYLRTKEPTKPKLLQSGQLSTRRDLDTTWRAYLSAIREHHLNVDDYADVQSRLRNVELDKFFPRYHMPVLQQESVLLRDFISSAKALNYIYENNYGYIPVRNVGQHCDWCSFNKLCEAVIVGDDDEPLKRKLFRAHVKEVVS